MAEYYGRTCGCGCGTCFETTYAKQLYLNNNHRQAHQRVVKWSHNHAVKYINGMYGGLSAGLEHYSAAYYHFYRLGIARRGDRYALAHNIGSHT